MKIILRQTVENLGKPGDIVNVKPGYAQNFLIPQQMAFPVTEGNIRRIENEKRQLIQREAKLKDGAQAIANEFKGTKLVFEMKAGLEGVLYGSVTTADIAEALEAKGLQDVDKRHIILTEAVKHIGEFKATIRLHPEVDLKFDILVKSEDGLAEQAMADAAEAQKEMAAEQEAAMKELSGEQGAEEEQPKATEAQAEAEELEENEAEETE